MADTPIRVIAGALKEFTERQIVKLDLDINANLIEATPVDTGWARANWIPSFGRPSQLEGEFLDPDRGDVQQRASKQQEATARVATNYKLEKGNLYATNNVPYIQRLNNGHSRKAPAGFVQQAIAKALLQQGGFFGG